MSDFQERLAQTNLRLAEACQRAGRKPSEVRIVAVSKTVPPDDIRDAAECGQIVFGESKVQEARQKIPMCPGHLEWHMVGHLQQNKVRDAVRLFRMIHSVDSLRLLEAINAACETAGNRMPVLLEVNVSGERSKFGMPPEEGPAVLEKSGGLMNVDVVGLMTVPPVTEDPQEARPFFRQLREFRDKWQMLSGAVLPELSMGMSHDFEVAVEEGATMVRLGTVLFGERKSLHRIADPDFSRAQ
jgi:PLP dependent protein